MKENGLPGDEILLKYTSGVLDPGVRCLVDAHLELAPQGTRRLAPFLRLAGDMLAREAPSGLSAGGLDRALAAIDSASPEPAAEPRSDRKAIHEKLRVGGWRWAGPGTRIAPVAAPGAATRVFMMKIASGRAMLDHGHTGREWTVILAGSYRDEFGHARPGDFIEHTQQDRHRPVVDSQTPCVCLIAMEGTIAARGLIGVAARWSMR